MIEGIGIIVLLTISSLLYKKYRVSVEKNKLMNYIIVVDEEEESNKSKRSFYSPILKKVEPDFLFIFGVKNIVISSFVLLFYFSFWMFVSVTFSMSVLSSLLGVTVLIFIWVFYVLKKFRLMFSDYFESNFPSALRMISRNMAVGQTIYSAIDSVALNLNGIMQKEFKRISEQLKNGASFEQILDKGEKLYPYKGYYVFSSYVKVSIKKGGSLKDTLLSLADDLISAQVIKKKTKALTSEARGAAKILACLPFIMLIVLFSFSRDNFFYLIEAYYGRIVSIYVVISVSIGFIIISRMIRKVEL